MASMDVTAPPPKKPVKTMSPDLELMKKIYRHLNIENLNNMSRHLGTAIVHDELRRQMDEIPEAERGGAKYKELSQCITELVTGRSLGARAHRDMNQGALGEGNAESGGGHCC